MYSDYDYNYNYLNVITIMITTIPLPFGMVMITNNNALYPCIRYRIAGKFDEELN